MRVALANVAGRASLVREERVIDLERRSSGFFSSDPMAALSRWDELCAWSRAVELQPSDALLDVAQLGPCVPRPSQVFAIGLNYHDHAEEIGLQKPAQPMTFTKFASCLSGARANVPLTSQAVDWEIELVVVIGTRAHRLSEERALDCVAGFCVGQDISDRRLQFSDVPPQFSLAKSATGFGPIGPAVVSRLDDEGHALDAQSFALCCDVNGVRMQDGNTRHMIFTVPQILVHLSRYCTLEPGDIIFTGTPSGVGSGRKPAVFLRAGDVIRSEIAGLGVLENTCVAG